VSIDREALRQMLARRVSLAGLYLCGPFDSGGEPLSPDIHVLAVSAEGRATDLHLLPGIAAVSRRIEVSVAPLADVEAAVDRGVADWPAFFLIDKLRKAAPIVETPALVNLRAGAAGALRLRPSFYSAALRGVAALAPGGGPDGPAGPAAILRANGSVLAALALSVIAARKQTFSKNSEMLAALASQRRPDWRMAVGPYPSQAREPAPEVARVVESARAFITAAVALGGIDFDRLQGEAADDHA